MSDPGPRPPDFTPEPARVPETEAAEGISAAEREALVAGAAARLVQQIEQEARAWERAARAIRDLRSVGELSAVRLEALRVFTEATRMRRGLFLDAEPSGRLVRRATLGHFTDEAAQSAAAICTNVRQRASTRSRIDWIEATREHPAFPATGEWNETVASAVLVVLGIGHRAPSFIYMDATTHRERPPGSELRALEFLAAEAASIVGQREAQLEETAESTALAAENERLRRLLGERSTFDALIGTSPAISAVRELAARVAGSSAPVLIQGEAGTGKAFLARVLHAAGPLASGPLVSVSCDTFDADHLGRVLFGSGTTEGRLRAAAAGTLLLERVEALSPDLQTRLEDVLRRSETAAGGDEAPVVPGRLISTCSARLADSVRAGRFRATLLSRLAAVTIELPPLRERGEDVVLLADHFLRELAERHGRHPRVLSADGRRHLLLHGWRGNVRELRELAERAVLLSEESGPVGPEDLGLGAIGAAVTTLPRGGTLREQLHLLERELIRTALIEREWNISQTARTLGISRQHLHNLIRKHGLRRDSSAGG